MSVTLSYLCCFVIEYLLFVFHQRTPLDWAAQAGRETVMAYLKGAADPNMLEVCETVALRIGVVSSGGAPAIVAAICFTCEGFTHESSLNWPW